MRRYIIKHALRLSVAITTDDILPSDSSFYTSYPLNEEAEYLGTFNGDVEECVAWLRHNGYHYQLFAAVKKVYGQKDKGSFARIPLSHPDEVAETALEDLDPRECQYHVHLYEGDGYVDLYGHYEIHPYPHYPTLDITRSYPRHYRPTWDRDSNPKEEWTYLRGVLDPRLEDELESYDRDNSDTP